LVFFTKFIKKRYEYLLMVEIQKKYQIKLRRVGIVDWIGAYNLYFKEINRFLIVWAQTLLSPLVSSLLFLSVLTLALGNDRGEVLGFSFISFLAPGLIAMSIIQQGFSHSVSSLMIAKIQGNIVDTLMAPLSAAEVTLAIILAAVTSAADKGAIKVSTILP
jgi:ABC-2 type transport system permease protein